ncbi:MAG: hypothetical protein CL946_02505 [Ectothiorhodospiraceae bacterium]|nr:hypothetical protein [Ectothiorhodospiraceae bacterium]
MAEYFAFIEELVFEYPYLILFLALFLENSLMLGIVIPGITVLILTSSLIHSGDVNAAACLGTAFAGTILGDNINYLLGRYGISRIDFVRKVLDKNSDIVERVHEEQTSLLIFFHFIVYMRTILPMTLGSSKFPFRRWIVYDVIGVSLFVSAFTLLGYIVGYTSAMINDAVDISNYISYIFGGLFVVWLVRVLFIIRKKRRERAMARELAGESNNPAG